MSPLLAARLDNVGFKIQGITGITNDSMVIYCNSYIEGVFAMSEEALPADTKEHEDFTDDDILKYTQRARKALVDDIIKGGPPNDPKDRSAMLQALSDMDQTAINNKRLGAQQKTADADREALMVISRLRQQMGAANPFKADKENDARVIEADYERLPEPDPVDGEMGIGLDSTNYDEFMDKFED